ncbi:MAG TPA: hypothetical protein VFC73_05270 [Syntrophomonadaceae bacterium]|nr:hypothetical protein [Syntrophomonadaceae bacterium]
MMKFDFSRGLKKEINEVELIFRESLKSRWGDIDGFAENIEADLFWMSIPEFVLLAYKYFDMEKDLSIKMAVIFKIVYLANYIHETIKDEDEGQEHNQELQFTILIGDYLFGKIMSLLLEANGGGLVDSFADMMVETNEGLVIKYKTEPDSTEVIRKTKASYYETAFVTAARLSGIDDEADLVFISELGISLGMVMYLIYTNAPHEEISKNIIQVNQLFKTINQRIMVVNSYLEKAIEEISNFSDCLNKVAAI